MGVERKKQKSFKLKMAENRPRHGKQIFKCLEHTLSSSQNKFQQKNGKQIFVDFFSKSLAMTPVFVAVFGRFPGEKNNLPKKKRPKTDPNTVNKFSKVQNTLSAPHKKNQKVSEHNRKKKTLSKIRQNPS